MDYKLNNSITFFKSDFKNFDSRGIGEGKILELEFMFYYTQFCPSLKEVEYDEKTNNI